MNYCFVRFHRSCLFHVVLLSVLLLLITIPANSQGVRASGHSPAWSTPDESSSGRSFTTRGSLWGTVQTLDKHPISDARIVVIDTSNGRSVAIRYTNSLGQFEINDLPRGVYEVVAEKGVSQAREQVRTDGAAIALTMRHVSEGAFNPGQQSISVQQMSVPGKAQRALAKAREWSARGKLDEARHEVAKALEIAPNFSDAFAFRGILALQSGDFASAETDLHKSIQLDNNNALAYVAMGAVYNMTNRFDDALRELNRGAVLDPKAWQAHFEISKAQLSKRMFSECLTELEKANALLGRNYSPMRLVRGQALYGVGSYAEAASEFQKYLDENNSSPFTQQVKKALQQAQTANATPHTVTTAVR